MASGSRLVYAMSRDGLFPASHLFRRVSPRSAVHVPAVLMFLVLGILATIFSGSIQQLLLAASVLPASIYLITVVAFLVRRSRITDQFGTFTLGRIGTPIAIAAACWLVATIAILTIPKTFRTASLVSLGLCAAGLIPWFGWFRGRVARGKAGHTADRVPPLPPSTS